MLEASFAYEVKEIPLQQIRTSSCFTLRLDGTESDEDFESLISSIRKHGVLEPVIVRPAAYESRHSDVETEEYELVCGNRRYLACRSLELTVLPAILRNLSDREALEVAMVENLQRRSLNPIEEAEAFKRYILNFGRGSMGHLTARIGKSQEYVSHRLLLLGLPKEIIKRISRRLLKAAQATELIWLKDPDKQIQLAEEITRRKLSFRETRTAVKKIRKEDLPVGRAVEEAIRESPMGRFDTDFLSDPKDDAEPWQNYCETYRSSKDMQIAKHAVLMIRSCLVGLDRLVEKTENRELRELILSERRNVHSSLDRMIRVEVSHRRDRR